MPASPEQLKTIENLTQDFELGDHGNQGLENYLVEHPDADDFTLMEEAMRLQEVGNSSPEITLPSRAPDEQTYQGVERPQIHLSPNESGNNDAGYKPREKHFGTMSQDEKIQADAHVMGNMLNNRFDDLNQSAKIGGAELNAVKANWASRADLDITLENGDEAALLGEVKRLEELRDDTYDTLNKEQAHAGSSFSQQIDNGGIKVGLETTIIFNEKADLANCVQGEMTFDQQGNLHVSIDGQDVNKLDDVGCVTTEQTYSGFNF